MSHEYYLHYWFKKKNVNEKAIKAFFNKLEDNGLFYNTKGIFSPSFGHHWRDCNISNDERLKMSKNEVISQLVRYEGGSFHVTDESGENELLIIFYPSGRREIEYLNDENKVEKRPLLGSLRIGINESAFRDLDNPENGDKSAQVLNFLLPIAKQLYYYFAPIYGNFYLDELHSYNLEINEENICKLKIMDLFKINFWCSNLVDIIGRDKLSSIPNFSVEKMSDEGALIYYPIEKFHNHTIGKKKEAERHLGFID